MSAWGRLGLIQAAIADAESTKRLNEHKNQEVDKNSSLKAVARVLGYESTEIESEKEADEQEPQGTENKVTSTKKSEATEEQLEPTKAKVPPAQFVVVKSKTVYHQQTDKPKELSGPTLTDWNNNKTAEQKEKDKNATLYFGLPSELMPSARYLPLLHNVLGQFNKTHKLDTKTVIRKTAAGKFLTKLPKQHLQQWPKSLLVVVDNSRTLEPYWYDFELIIAALKKLLGNSVTSIAFDKDSIRSNHTPWCRYSNWPGRGEGFKFEYFADNNPFAQADAILLLSDLGTLKPYASHHLSEFISAKISPSQRKRKQFLTLSPVDLTRKTDSFLNPVAMVDTVKLPRFPKHTNNSPNKKLNHQVTTLLAAVAYLPVFDVALLRKLRIELTLGGSYLDGIIWNHEHISGNQVGKLVDVEHKNYYRELFQTTFSSQQKSKIWQVVNQHFTNAVEGLNQLVALQQFTSEAVNKKNSELKNTAAEYFAALAASYDQQGESSANVLLKAQCKTAFDALSENIDDTTYQLLAAAAYKDDIQNGRWPEELPLSLKPKLAYLYGKNTPKIETGLCFIEVSNRRNSIAINEFDESFSESLGVFETLEYYLDGIVEVSFSRAEGSDKNEASLDLKAKKISVKGRKVFAIPEGCEINIDSGLEKLTLNLTSRKSNLSDNSIGKMGYKKNKDNKLIYLNKNPKFFSNSYAAVWKKIGVHGDRNANNEHQRWRWRWRYAEPIETINSDEYGTYLDLNLFGIIQRFRWINPGTFLMGSPRSEKGRFDNETQHQVTLTQGFWLADSTCTQALWQAVMGNNPSRFKGKNKPVENVSWLDAQAFIEKLTEEYPGIGFRLPTEAEWEYACRAGTLTPFSFGEELTLKHANYRGNLVFGGEPDKNALMRTCDVTDFPPNPWGLYQMHGNVREWCNDRYVGDLSARSVTDPIGPEDGALRALRGGGWNGFSRELRSASRDREGPDFRNDNRGLRLSLGHELQGGGADSERSEPNSRGRDSRENFSKKAKKKKKSKS